MDEFPSAPAESRTPATAAPDFNPGIPGSVLYVAVILIGFLGLLTLETSDSLVHHGGQIARSAFVLPIVALLLWGLLTRHRWAWRASRLLSAAAVGLYSVAAAGAWLFPGHLAPGLRIWISGVSVALLAFSASAYLALGRRTARAFFRIPQRSEKSVTFPASRTTSKMLS